METLRAVAATTDGNFFRAENGAELERIYGEIDELAPVKLQTETWRPKLPLYQWPLGAAALSRDSGGRKSAARCTCEAAEKIASVA